MDLSIVVPAFNEEGNLEALVAEIKAAVLPLACRFEIWFVNDGSRDRSAAILNQLRQIHPNIGIVHLSQNAGHQAALLRGIRAVAGRVVISLDADFQHPPALIPVLWRKWQETNCDVVQSQRDDLQNRHDSAFKRLLSRAFYRLCNACFGANLVEGGADFRLIGPRVLQELHGDARPQIFLRGFTAQEKFAKSLVTFKVQRRRFGESKYSLRKQVALGLLGIRELLLHRKDQPGFLSWLMRVSYAFFPRKVWDPRIEAIVGEAHVMPPRISMPRETRKAA